MTEHKHLAYICAPFRGDVEHNIERAKEYAKYVYDKGLIPVTPHVMFPFLNDDNQEERESAMHMDLELLSKCEYMYVFGNTTEGMQKELEFAKENSIVCYFINEEVFEKRCDNKYIEWLRKEVINIRDCAKENPELEGILSEYAEMFDRIADRLERLV